MGFLHKRVSNAPQKHIGSIVLFDRMPLRDIVCCDDDDEQPRPNTLNVSRLKLD